MTVEGLEKNGDADGASAVISGVRVVGVEGAGKEAGIRRGDIIVRLDDQAVLDTSGFGEIARELEAGRLVPVLVIRNQMKRFLALRVPRD